MQLEERKVCQWEPIITPTQNPSQGVIACGACTGRKTDVNGEGLVGWFVGLINLTGLEAQIRQGSN